MVKVIKTKEQLEAEDWQLASVSGGEHLKRTLEMYQELGFEAYLEEVSADTCVQCAECFKAGNEKANKIYTRAKESDRDS